MTTRPSLFVLSRYLIILQDVDDLRVVALDIAVGEFILSDDLLRFVELVGRQRAEFCPPYLGFVARFGYVDVVATGELFAKRRVIAPTIDQERLRRPQQTMKFIQVFTKRGFEKFDAATNLSLGGVQNSLNRADEFAIPMFSNEIAIHEDRGIVQRMVFHREGID